MLATIEIGDLVYEPEFNTVGFVVDLGFNPSGSRWYRTTSNGVREREELVKIIDESHLQKLLTNGASIAPSDFEKLNGNGK